MSKFKVGDEVILSDDCWGKFVNVETIDCKYATKIRSKFDSGEIRVFTVLAVDARIPVCENKFANTLLQDVQSSKIVTVNDCNILAKPEIKVRFFSNGKDVTDGLSEQSRRAVLKANNY